MNQPFNFPINSGGKASNIWLLFFKYLFNGDEGKDFSPTYTNLTGTATHTARYFRISQNLYYLRIRIVPDTSTSSVAGSTYLDFPLSVPAFGNLGVVNETSNQSLGSAVINTNQRIYLPTWATVTAPITISGMVEAL